MYYRIFFSEGKSFWLIDWAFVLELRGFGFQSQVSHLMCCGVKTLYFLNVTSDHIIILNAWWMNFFIWKKKKKKKKKFCCQYFCLWKVRKLQSLWCHHGHTAHTCSFYCKDWKLVPGLFMILIKQQDIVICWFFVDDGYYFWVSHCTPSKKVKTLHSS